MLDMTKHNSSKCYFCNESIPNDDPEFISAYTFKAHIDCNEQNEFYKFDNQERHKIDLDSMFWRSQ